MAMNYFDYELFDLSALIINIEIKLCARIESGVKQLLSIVTSNGELILHYVFGGLKPVAKRIPWFNDCKKAIQHISFDPSATWLLVLTLDSSLYIVPALKILDPEQKIDCKWSVNDLTYFPRTQKCPGGSATPGCVIWWQTLECNQNAIIGYDTGEICFVSLTDGQVIGTTSINGPVTNLNICQDNSLDSVTLLITSESKQQWRLLLEQRSTSYIWSQDGFLSKLTNVSALDTVFGINNSSLSLSSNSGDCDTKISISKSRLQGFKQMSVEKFANFKQKLTDKGIKNNLLKTERDTVFKYSDRKSLNDDNNSQIADITQPEKLTNLGETFLRPQYAKNRYLFSGYFNPTSLLTIHGVEIDSIPLYVHKLHINCRDILMTDKFFFTVDQNYNSVSIVSCQLSESRLDGDTEFNPDALIATFDLPNKNEIVLALYKFTDVTLITEHPINVNNRSNNTQQDSKHCSTTTSLFTLPKTVDDLNIRNPKVDTCIIVTNFGVYKIVLKCSIIQVFMYFVCEENNIEKAERLALIFGLNLQNLLELAGDLLLANNKFVEAISLYKLSRCRLLKSVLKFAVAGNANELLTYIQTCLAAPNIEISLPTKIHLSNLAVMSYTEKHLRLDKFSRLKSKNLKEFVEFLSRNDYYDQVLAVNVLCQTSLWNLMTILIRTRGLIYDVLETVCKLIKSTAVTDNNTPTTTTDTSTIFSTSTRDDFNDESLFVCLTEPANIQCLLTKPSIAKIYFNFVRFRLDVFQAHILQRLVELLDPSNVLVRPIVAKLFEVYKSKQQLMSTSSLDSVIDSTESSDSYDEQINVFQDLIETFITVILKRIHKLYNGPVYDHELMHLSKLSYFSNGVEQTVSYRKYRTLSAGYGHVALIRNNSVWTWGITAYGCLGLGPLMTKFQLPEQMFSLNNLWSTIISVSCGRTHTLILTNFGVYSCGSNLYGQLGHAQLMQTPYPLLIDNFCNELIMDVCAGQYHSLALTATGKVYSWGWGVHGQLGHADVEDVRTPKQIEYFKDITIAQIAAGHAHTLVLSSKGVVYSFGSNFFGQLGIGTNRKCNIPQQIFKMPEKIVYISTEYFQNFAVSITNKLYTWGASPQVLRLAAQAQKKAKLLNQSNNTTVVESPSANNKRSDDVPTIVNTADDSSVDKLFDDKPVVATDLVTASTVDTDDESNNTKISKQKYETRNSEDDQELQPHLQPKLVDTSNVNGTIVNVASGCHHAALLTKDGTLYTWGKNLDGQLGTGSRKEVFIPTPVKINPANFVNGINTPVKQDDTNLQELKCSYIACGAEFTVAIDSQGRVLAWGNNSYAQLGKLPDEDQKGLEGKMVLLKTTKRIIKLPSTFQNICDTPKEIINIPSQIICYRNVERKPFIHLNQPHFYPLAKVESQNNDRNVFKYGPRTLHFILETYRGFYNSDKILKQCLKYGNYQAAAKISYLECHLTDSLNYQLKSLECVINAEELKTVHKEQNLIPPEPSGNNVKVPPVQSIIVNDTSDITCSPSLESIKQFNDDLESQGGHEEMCDSIPDVVVLTNDRNIGFGDIDEDKKILVRNTILEYVDSIDKQLITDDHSLLTVQNLEHAKNSANKHLDKHTSTERSSTDKSSYILDNRNGPMGDCIHFDQIESTNELHYQQTIDYASDILTFYIEKTQNNENHILMQNILIKSMDFWLTNNLPTDILESILLKNIAKYFYPLSILLFCKNFNNNLGETITSSDHKQTQQNSTESSQIISEDKSFLFLKQLSTKFCLQLCSMVLKNNTKSTK